MTDLLILQEHEEAVAQAIDVWLFQYFPEMEGDQRQAIALNLAHAAIAVPRPTVKVEGLDELLAKLREQAEHDAEMLTVLSNLDVPLSEPESVKCRENYSAHQTVVGQAADTITALLEYVSANEALRQFDVGLIGSYSCTTELQAAWDRHMAARKGVGLADKPGTDLMFPDDYTWPAGLGYGVPKGSELVDALQAELAEARDALTAIERLPRHSRDDAMYIIADMQRIARTALKENDDVRG
jgi:hypothetical protein